MGVERLFPAAELPDGTMRLTWPGGSAVLIANRGGNFFAVGGVCTHEYCELIVASSLPLACHGPRSPVLYISRGSILRAANRSIHPQSFRLQCTP